MNNLNNLNNLKQNKTITYEGLESKLKIIGNLIKRGSENIIIRNKVIDIIGNYNIQSTEQLKKIYDFLFYNIKYVSDINNVETLYSAEKVLMLGYGDCDDKVILGGAMLRTIGYHIFITIASLNIDWTHIFLIVYSKKTGFIYFDTSTLQYSFNYLPNYPKIRMYYLY